MSGKPLSATQQRNMEILLSQDLNALQEEVSKRLDAEWRTEKQKIHDDWNARHPDVAKVEKKVRDYLKRVDKRMREFAKDLADAGLPASAQTRAVLEGQSFFHYPFGLNTAPDLSAAWTKAEREHNDRYYKMRCAIQELRSQKQREILLATLDSSQVALTLPTSDEFLATL